MVTFCDLIQLNLLWTYSRDFSLFNFFFFFLLFSMIGLISQSERHFGECKSLQKCNVVFVLQRGVGGVLNVTTFSCLTFIFYFSYYGNQLVHFICIDWKKNLKIYIKSFFDTFVCFFLLIITLKSYLYFHNFKV